MWMAEARGKAEWGRTSALLALTANMNRDPKKGQPFTPSDFNPYERHHSHQSVPKLADLSILKAVFVDRVEGRKMDNTATPAPATPVAPQGITEVLALLQASKDISVLIYKARKASATPSELPQRLATLLITSPQVIDDLKVAAEGITKVPAELKDLSLLEAFQFIAAAGKLAADAAQEIQAA